MLANGLTVDAKGVATSLLKAQDRVFASFEMITTASEADTYLKAVLAGVPEASAAPPR